MIVRVPACFEKVQLRLKKAAGINLPPDPRLANVEYPREVLGLHTDEATPSKEAVSMFKFSTLQEQAGVAVGGVCLLFPRFQA